MIQGLQTASYSELERRRQEALSTLREFDDELDKRRKIGRLITRHEDIQWVTQGSFGETRNPTSEVRLARVVSPELGFDVYNFRALILEMAAGCREGVNHSHGEVVKHYLDGSGQEIIEGKVLEVKSGDTVFIPAGAWHGTINTGDEPLRFFAVGQNTGTSLHKPVYRRIQR